jgi:GNAT superfamily N-acetyltransferase
MRRPAAKRSRPALPDTVFRAVTPSRWNDLEQLFGERGACGGCWCMVWRLTTREWTAGKGARNRRAMMRLVKSGARPGVLAYRGRDAIGWCAIAPRRDYSALARSRVLRPVDDEAVWSISCLFIRKADRRSGLSARLLRAAVEFAAKRGARIVEGYPIEPTMERTPDPFVWTGVPSAFRRAGFTEVARRSRSRPIMRVRIG